MPRQVKADLQSFLATRDKAVVEKVKFNEVIDQAAIRLGPGGILGVTNFSDYRFEQLAEKPGYPREHAKNAFYVPSRDILVVRGQEVGTNQGHLLVLGLDKKVLLPDGEDLDITLGKATGQNGIIIASHPFFSPPVIGIRGVGPELLEAPHLLKYFHGFEVYNGSAFWGNRLAQGFYDGISQKEYDVGALSTQDAHSIRGIGLSNTRLMSPMDGTVFNADSIRTNLGRNIRAHKDYENDVQRRKWGEAAAHMGRITTFALALKCGKDLDAGYRDPPKTLD